MDQADRTGRENVLDLECGTNNAEKDSKVTASGTGKSNRVAGIIWSDFERLNGSVEGVDVTRFCNHPTDASDINPGITMLSAVRISREDNAILKEKRLQSGKPIKPSCKKPPKPPRPPRGPSLDAADQKLIQQISELAMLKRARVERVKVLKRMKANKSSSSNGSLCAMIITIIFCLIILLQGVFSQSNSNVKFQGSPVAAMTSTASLISVQFNSNNSIISTSAAISASPSLIEQR